MPAIAGVASSPYASVLQPLLQGHGFHIGDPCRHRWGWHISICWSIPPIASGAWLPSLAIHAPSLGWLSPYADPYRPLLGVASSPYASVPYAHCFRGHGFHMAHPTGHRFRGIFPYASDIPPMLRGHHPIYWPLPPVGWRRFHHWRSCQPLLGVASSPYASVPYRCFRGWLPHVAIPPIASGGI